MKALKIPAVCERVAKSRAQIYREIQLGTFPRPIKSGRSSIWLDEDIDRYLTGLRDQQRRAEGERVAA